MTSPFQRLAQEEYSQNPEPGKKNPYKSPFEQLAASDENQEGFFKGLARTAAQPVQGYLATTRAGLLGQLWQLLAMGEVLDPEELDRIEEIAHREKIPFNREEYLEKAQEVLGTVPTVSNIASAIEKRTDAPLEPKTKLQKGLRLATEAARLAPSPGAFRGTNIALPKPVLGAGVAGTSELLKQAGVPEPLADVVSFGVLKHAPQGGPSITFGKQKPSGLPERGFEKITGETKVSEGKLAQINEKVESDFRKISDKIIKESPVGETANNLKNDPTFKQQSRELLNQAQELADTRTGSLPTLVLKKEIADLGAKNTKGLSLGEYDKSYLKYSKENIDDLLSKNMTHGELVEQYRKNNKSLSEYFEPGSSKALNRGKRDSILDYNRAIAKVIEKTDPELSAIFKEGNERWTKIMDAEAVDSFVNQMFEEKMNYGKMQDFFDQSGLDRIFKRALGEKGYKEFEQLMKDMLVSEAPYKMLKVAQSKGYKDLVQTMMGYMIHPNLGFVKAGLDAAKFSWKTLMNSMLDKPTIGITFNKGIQNIKKGDFAAAGKNFESIRGELEIPQEANLPAKQATGETIDVTPKSTESVKPLETLKPPSKQKIESQNTRENIRKNLQKFSVHNQTLKRGLGEIIVKKDKKVVGGLDYSHNPEGIWIEHIFSETSGAAAKAIIEFVKQFPKEDLWFGPLTEKGQKAFEMLTGKKIPARIKKNETISETLKRPRIDYKLTELDKELILSLEKNREIEYKQQVKPKIEKEPEGPSLNERKAEALEKKSKEIKERISRLEEREEKLKQTVKENPNSANAKRLLSDNEATLKNSRKLLKQLEEEGVNLLEKETYKKPLKKENAKSKVDVLRKKVEDAHNKLLEHDENYKVAVKSGKYTQVEGTKFIKKNQELQKTLDDLIQELVKAEQKEGRHMGN